MMRKTRLITTGIITISALHLYCASLLIARQHITIIRDYHCHYETQKEIAAIIDKLDSASDTPILLEGAYGGFNLEPIALYPDKPARDKVSDYLMRTGLISGAEYYAILTQNPDAVYGIDDRTTYLQSLNMFRTVTAQRNELRMLTTFFERTIDPLIEQHCSPTTQSFLQLCDDAAQGNIDFASYLVALEEDFARDIDWNQYPHITEFLDLHNTFSLMNPSQVTMSKDAFFAWCRQTLPEDEYTRLTRFEVQYRIAAISAGEYWPLIESISMRYMIDQPEFVSFLDILRYESLLLARTRELDTENQRLQWDVLHKLAKSLAEKRVVELVLFADYCQQLFSFSVPSYTIDFYRKKFDSFDYEGLYALLDKEDGRQIVYDLFSRALRTVEDCFLFYALSMQRDNLMALNIHDRLQQLSSPTESVVVCGAMHVDRLRDLLRAKGYEVSVKYPDIQADTSSVVDSVYLARMMGDPAGLDGFLVEPVYLAFAAVFADEPFLTRFGYLSKHIPPSQAVKVALVTTSFADRIRDSANTPELVDIAMAHIDTILSAFVDDSDQIHINVSSVQFSEDHELLSFELELLDSQTMKPQQRLRVSRDTAAIDHNWRDVLSRDELPTGKNAAAFKKSFIRSLESSKAHFDEFIELAHTSPQNVGPLLFGPMFMRLNRVPGSMLERFHHKNIDLRRDDYIMPFVHALDVATNINLNGVDRKYHRVMRLAALTHNLWRVYGTYPDFAMSQEPGASTVTITYTDQWGKKVTINGTHGEISANLIPHIVSEMGVPLENWELNLLTRLVLTSDLFGVIGKSWDANYAKAGFTFASQSVQLQLEDYLQLARRLYESDILTIYTASLSEAPVKDVEHLLDISTKIDEILGQATQVAGVPVVGEEKNLFFASLSLNGPDFMRMVTRAMADDEFAAAIFPKALLDLKHIPGDSTPVIHHDPETGRAINPYIHSLNAALLINIGEITNIRALRIAILLHDIGKATFESYKSAGYTYHAERGAEMIDDVLDQWGIRDHLSAREVALIKFLVANHDMLNRYDQPSTMWTYNIPRIIEEIDPPQILKDAGFDFFTALKYVRRVMQADANSVPKLKGKFQFNKLESLFADFYTKRHRELWDSIGERYSPNASLDSGDHVIHMALLKLLGNENGFHFEDPSQDITKPFAPEPVVPLETVAGAGRSVLDSSL